MNRIKNNSYNRKRYVHHIKPSVRIHNICLQKYQRLRTDIISQNLANINTTREYKIDTPNKNFLISSFTLIPPIKRLS